LGKIRPDITEANRLFTEFIDTIGTVNGTGLLASLTSACDTFKGEVD
jgi:hypothetical protein